MIPLEMFLNRSTRVLMVSLSVILKALSVGVCLEGLYMVQSYQTAL